MLPRMIKEPSSYDSVTWLQAFSEVCAQKYYQQGRITFLLFWHFVQLTVESVVVQGALECDGHIIWDKKNIKTKLNNKFSNYQEKKENWKFRSEFQEVATEN